MDNVHPAHRCTSPLGVVPVGLGDGVLGDGVGLLHIRWVSLIGHVGWEKRANAL